MIILSSFASVGFVMICNVISADLFVSKENNEDLTHTRALRFRHCTPTLQNRAFDLMALLHICNISEHECN